MKKTIFSKIFSGYLIIAVVLSFLILAFSFRTIRTYHIQTLKTNLTKLGEALELKLGPMWEGSEFKELDRLVKEVGKDIDTRITLIDPDGIVWADSEEDPNDMENHSNRPEIMTAYDGEVGSSIRFSNTIKQDMLYVALPLREEGKVTGVLRVSLFLSDINSFLFTFRTKILSIATVIIALSIIAAALFARSLSKPLKEISDASERVAAGDFSTRVFLKTKGEVKELGDRFNYMAEALNAFFKRLTEQKEELDSIISSIDEGLAVIDKEGRIVITNSKFNLIAEEDSPAGKFHWEILREPRLTELINGAVNKKSGFQEEIQWRGKVLLTSASYLEAREAVVLILHDVTEIRGLEHVKKAFVTNVSHELRTPLTSIKGFVETIEDDVNEEAKRYLEIIKRNTERLINIVNDLLVLSELEEKGMELQTEDVDIKSLTENVAKIFEHKIQEKGIKLSVECEKNMPRVKADPFKLEQMLINIIDNAIKYTEKGNVKVSLKKREEQARIEIKDSGIGIPEKHLSRIFERFYVADKSRSKKMGGTGLGLSIVKHIVLLHNGTIDVESQPNTGTTFTIDLPLA